MDIPTEVAMRVFPIEKLSNDPDPSRCVVHMPVGAKPCGFIILDGNKMGVPVILPRVVGTRVPHSFVLMQADIPVLPLLGRHFGQPLGVVVMFGHPVALVPEYPWPEAVQTTEGERHG